MREVVLGTPRSRGRRGPGDAAVFTDKQMKFILFHFIPCLLCCLSISVMFFLALFYCAAASFKRGSA